MLEEVLDSFGPQHVRVTSMESLHEHASQSHPDLCLLFSPSIDEIAILKECTRDQTLCPLLAIFEEHDFFDIHALDEAGIEEFLVLPESTATIRKRIIFTKLRHSKTRQQALIRSTLTETEAKSKAVLDTTVDAIITINTEGIIESFNQAAERIFAYTADEVIGKNVKILMPNPYKDEHDGYIHSYRDTGHRKIIGIGREVVARRKDGSTFPIELAVSEVQLKDRKIFTGIIRDITTRLVLEKELVHASEEERRRIGQDLHDGLGQMLTGISLITQNIGRKLLKQDEKDGEEVLEIARLVKEADQHARTLARGLIPVEFASEGLGPALRRLASNTQKLSGISCSFEQHGDIPDHVDSRSATYLFRIAQEALTNAVRHSGASRLHLIMAGGKDHIRIRIRDNGSGIHSKSEQTGMGLRIMHHRAHILGATLDVKSTPNEGTTITCTYQLATI